MDHDQLERRGELFADVVYRHAAAAGRPQTNVPVQVGVVVRSGDGRLAEVAGPVLLCEFVFVADLRVGPRSSTPPHLRGAGVTDSVIRNMEAYGRPRGVPLVGFSGLVNPGLVGALRRRGFSTLSASLDAHLDFMVARSEQSPRDFEHVFSILHRTLMRTESGVVLVRRLPQP